MNHRHTVSFSFATVALFVSGCAPTSPVFDQNFGASVKTLTAQQVRNPNAPVANRDTMPDGLDGRAALGALENYERSYVPAPTQQNTPRNTFVIGIPSATAGGAP